MVLTFINPLNKNYKGEFIYEFLFSETEEINFGEDWDTTPASSGVPQPPPIDEMVMVGLLKIMDTDLELAVSSDHFSMYDCVEKVIALAWERESPDNETRLVFHFGESMDSVKEKIYSRDKIMTFEKIK
jgi:hypothetical protein